MRTTTSDQPLAAPLLATLLPDWKRRLQAWCLDGTLSAAAQQAFLLAEFPAALQKLVDQWSQGEFSALPPIVLLPAAAMNGAAGAYAISCRTIYLNADWLLEATPAQVLAVLSEELGHHLDALHNTSDTPGDEGELFAALLQGNGTIDAERRDQMLAENDLGSVELDGDVVAVERAVVVSTPIPVRLPGRSSGEFANTEAFAVLKGDGSVVTWGNPIFGGDSRAVDRQLRSGVTQIYSTGYAFAALKSDGSVVTWGSASGGDSSQVASQLLSGVTKIFSTSELYQGAFAALKSDGSVVTWGTGSSADSSRVASQLSSGVTSITSTATAFAALKADGSVITWGDRGGDSSAVAHLLRSGVSEIVSANEAFAALKADGSVVSWGSNWSDTSGLGAKLRSGVQRIFSNYYAFAALKTDGSVVTWGFSGYGNYGGDSSAVADLLSSNVTQIVSTALAFAALKSDGSFVTWGSSTFGGDSSGVADQLHAGVTEIFSTGSAFAALKNDGSVVTWGWSGGDSSAVAGQLSSGVTKIFSTNYPSIGAFAALKSDGSVVTWGGAGGNSSVVASQLSSGVTQIFSTDFAFAALKADGSVVTWGDASRGGDSSTVASLLNNVVAFASPFTDDRLVEFDPPQPEISIRVSPAWIPEDGHSKLIYTFIRTGDLTNALTINYSVTGSASPDVDYSGIATTPATKSVSFQAGAAATSVTVEVIEDSDIEPDETVILRPLPRPDYGFDPATVAVGTILNDDPKDYTAGPISIAGVNLGSTSLGTALRIADQEPLQVIYPYGYASPSNPGRGWQPVAAGPTGNGSALYWRTSSNGPTARWDLDDRGVYISGFLLSPFQLTREESSLHFDLNGDGYTAGPHTIHGINLGSTSLGYALRIGNAAPLQVTYSGINASVNNPGDGWIAKAATVSGSYYFLYWHKSGSKETVRWQLNSSGAYISGSLLSPSQLISEEANLSLDLDGDGIIAVSLGRSPEGEAVLTMAPAPIPVTDSSGLAVPSNRGDGWKALAVAVSGNGFSLYWGQQRQSAGRALDPQCQRCLRSQRDPLSQRVVQH
jgi:hypothetical protein